METNLKLRIILENPTAGVDFGLQKNGGNNFETIQKQRSDGRDLLFEFYVRLKPGNNISPVFLGPFVQGPPHNRFVYLGIGTFAGQTDSEWSRRLKIPLTGITSEMIQQSVSDPKRVFETLVPGTGKGGGPNCGTVKPFNGWKIKTFVPARNKLDFSKMG